MSLHPISCCLLTLLLSTTLARGADENPSLSDLGFSHQCTPSKEHVHRGYFIDGTTVNLARVESLEKKIKSGTDQGLAAEIIEGLGKGLEVSADVLGKLVESIGLLDGDGTVVGRAREGFMGQAYREHSRYWSGPGLLNFGLKVFDVDHGKLKIANPFLKNSTLIAGDVHNWVCEDFRQEKKNNPNLKSFTVHFAGYSRGGEIAVEVVHKLLRVWGCIGMKDVPTVGSLVVVDPNSTAMGIMDPFSITWPKEVPDQMPKEDVLVLEKTITKKDDPGLPLWEFVNLFILKTQRLDGTNHILVYGDGQVREDGRTPGGKKNAPIDHFEISHNLVAAKEMLKFMSERGACFSFPVAPISP